MLLLNAALLLLTALFLAWADGTAKGRRKLPLPAAKGAPAPVYRVTSEREVYDVYRAVGLHGARVIHLNRNFNMVQYMPKRETSPMPFPIQTYDIRPAYVEGLTSHNWLFIAARNALVRTVTSVLPDPVFAERKKDLENDKNFAAAGRVYKGYSFDVPRVIGTLDALPLIEEPVVVDVDAGFFIAGAEPREVAGMLHKKCPDVRAIVLIGSTDEPEVTDAMRGSLRLFEEAWGKQP